MDYQITVTAHIQTMNSLVKSSCCSTMPKANNQTFFNVQDN